MRGISVKQYLEENPKAASKKAVVDANIFYRETNTDYRANIFEGKLKDIPEYFQDIMTQAVVEKEDGSLYIKTSLNIDTV